jgi:hypothetical protein
MRHAVRRLCSAPAVLAVLAAGSCAGSSARVVRVEGAAPADLDAFEFTDRAAWRFSDDGGGSIELFAQSKYAPPFRSPVNIALMRGAEFGDFDLVVRARQTGPEYPHRDLVLVFAYRDAAHFAYAHFASHADDNAHQIMLVDGADRRPVTTARNDGIAWGDGWHELRLVRRGSQVQAFFDGGSPVLRGEVPVRAGRVGVGSFDDTGRFADLRVIGS